jgi:hypothetical protein
MGGQHQEINKTLLAGFGKKKNGAAAPFETQLEGDAPTAPTLAAQPSL